MLSLFTKILDIDDLDNRFVARLFFAILLFMRWMAYFMPFGDSDLSGLYSWYESAMQDPSIYSMGYSNGLSDFGLSVGNGIYILTLLGVSFLSYVLMFIYAGVMIREHRLGNGEYDSLKPISEGKLIFRSFFLVIALAVMFCVASVFLIMLFIFFFLLIPFVAVFCGCYISGDSKFFEAFSDCRRRMRGNYIFCLRIVGILGLLGLILQFGMSALEEVMNPQGFYVINAFLSSFSILCTARGIGVIYCFVERTGMRTRFPRKKVNEAPGKGSRIK